jgi:hypothetical protein
VSKSYASLNLVVRLAALSILALSLFAQDFRATITGEITDKTGANANKVIDAFVGGWNLNWIYRFNSGNPVAGILYTPDRPGPLPLAAPRWIT